MTAVTGSTVSPSQFGGKRASGRGWLTALILFVAVATVWHWKPWVYAPNYPSTLRGIGLPVSVWQNKFGRTPQGGCLYTYCYFNSAAHVDYVDFVERELHSGTTYSEALNDATSLLPKDSTIRSHTIYTFNVFSPSLAKYSLVNSQNTEAGWISVCFYPGPDSQGNVSANWGTNQIRIIEWADYEDACGSPLMPSNMLPAFQ